MFLAAPFFPPVFLTLVAFGAQLAVTPCVAQVAVAPSLTTATRERLLDKLKGAVYRAEKGTVRLKDGEFVPKGGNRNGWINLETDTVAFAPEPDTAPIGAAVALIVNGGGTATWTELHAVRFVKGVPRDLGYASIGPGVKRMSIQGDEITVTGATYAPDDPRCCPSLETTATYRLTGSTLVRKVSDAEVEDSLQTYVGAMTNRAALEITMAVDPQAAPALTQLSAYLQQAKAKEAAALAEIRKLHLRSDPRFKAAIASRIEQNQKAFDSQNMLTFAQASPGQQRAILVLGQVLIELKKL
ncbi:MAG TPA: LppP/LprE family lipoprotein, partial [Syntrophobacteraceae bacterium]|nr:LppP/LprE family lipoprotein [Syntrophobacteraceae bacterium]